tara:strand:+ start:2348 stop:3220 length:873 start_codon:yes stop_codon:yes gene_type:complete
MEKNMEYKNFAIFILTYGRSDRVLTYKTLIDSGYNGLVYFICSNDDKDLSNYKKLYKEKIIVFSKKDYKNKFDIGDNFNDDRVVVYARNACFDIAKKINIKYFLVLDDDYTKFDYRINNKGQYPKGHFKIAKNINKVIDRVLYFYKSISAKTIALAQGGDFIGGSENNYANNTKLRRKCMNSFFCSTDRPFKFVGRINEDVNTYVQNGTIGDLFFTIPILSLTQKITQSNKGGLTEIYLDKGTYIKSFYSVMFTPSAVKIALMGDKHIRLHHRVTWNNAVPKIIDEQYKK